MTKVLHVYRTYFPDPPGGLQEAIRQIARATAVHGVESRVFTLSPHPDPAQLDLPDATVMRARSWAAPASCDIGGIGAFRLFADLTRWADIIHYHFPWPFADLLHLGVRPTIPAVMTYHSDVVRQRLLSAAYAPLRNRMLRAMSRVIATSPAYARSSPILSALSLRDKVAVIPLGIDPKSYPEASGTVLPRLGLAESEPFFLFIGVLRYYKGLHTLIEAARHVDTKIVIAGSGPELDRLKALAAEHRTTNVVFAHQVTGPEKVALLERCTALVLPSHLRSEAFGMVLVEAAMFGKPSISCEIGTGTSYVNLHGETGLVVSPEDPTALARAMQQLTADRSMTNAFGAAARERFSNHFSGDVMGKSYASLYREVTKQTAADERFAVESPP
ncbi:MAG: glycosyltransferase [Pseudomonadota bacterium]